MAKGRIKRLQAARSGSYVVAPEGQPICVLCDRPIPPGLKDAHHLVPKSRGGVATVLMHRICHKHIHAVLTETELARHYATVAALQAHPVVATFVQWVKDKPIDFNPPVRRNRHKGLR
ncbi:HNH endonuclease [Comamonadaceae bacterium M7527]|nr:HNH endonuclease [Comamonadaceae bacterium M7527]